METGDFGGSVAVHHAFVDVDITIFYVDMKLMLWLILLQSLILLFVLPLELMWCF